MKKSIVSTGSLALLLMISASCDRDPQSAANTAAAPTAAPTSSSAAPKPVTEAAIDIGSSVLVSVNTTQKTAEPMLMAASHVITAPVTPPQAGNLIGVDVHVGTYAGRSDGVIKVRACQSAACAEGTADVANAKDNEFFTVPFSSRLKVDTSSPLTLSVSRESGSNEFAIWMLPSDVESTLADGSRAKKVPNVGLRYEPSKAAP